MLYIISVIFIIRFLWDFDCTFNMNKSESIGWIILANEFCFQIFRWMFPLHFSHHQANRLRKGLGRGQKQPRFVMILFISNWSDLWWIILNSIPILIQTRAVPSTKKQVPSPAIWRECYVALDRNELSTSLALLSETSNSSFNELDTDVSIDITSYLHWLHWFFERSGKLGKYLGHCFR